MLLKDSPPSTLLNDLLLNQVEELVALLLPALLLLVALAVLSLVELGFEEDTERSTP